MPSTQKMKNGSRGGEPDRSTESKNLLDEPLPRNVVPPGLLGGALCDGNGFTDPQELNVFSRADLLIALDLLGGITRAHFHVGTELSAEDDVLPGFVSLLQANPHMGEVRVLWLLRDLNGPVQAVPRPVEASPGTRGLGLLRVGVQFLLIV